MGARTDAPHVGTGELLRLMDGDGDSVHLSAWRDHVDGCPACADRMARLEQRSARVRQRVAEIELPPTFRYPTMPPHARLMGAHAARRAAGMEHGWLRAAAVILVLLLPFVAVPTLRAAASGWISAGWSQAKEIVGRAESPSPPPPLPAGDAPPSVVWFTPSSDGLLIEIAGRQQAGTLVLRPVDSVDGSLVITGGSGDATPTISEGGIRIANGPGSTANYEIGVPATVRRLTLRIADDPPIEVLRSGLAGARSFNLAASPR